MPAIRKKLGIVLLLLVTATVGCGRKTSREDDSKNPSMEVQVPTATPTITAESEETPIPTKQPEESSMTDQPSAQGEEDMMEYVRMDLPEEYTMLKDEKNKVITIAKEGRKVGRMTLYQAYRGKHEAASMVADLLGMEGYVRAVKTYDKEFYDMSKVIMETGLTKEDIQSGKLFSGNEELVYLYYQDKIPTTVITFEVSNLNDEAAMDRIAATVQLIK